MVESAVKSRAEVVVDYNGEKPIRVLHVDDDASLLRVAKQCLEVQGQLQVDIASSVEEALAKLEKKHFDVVVSDYQMPGKNGLQFLEELRKNGNDIPFILFTGKGREEVAIQALNCGAEGYIDKKGSPETVYGELTHKVKSALKRKKVEEELRVQREELQIILDSLPLQIWHKDKNNRLVRVNKRFAEYMGVSKENLEGKPLCDLFPPDVALKCWEEDKEVITTGQPKIDILDRHESAQGVRWFSTGKIPYREKDGNIIGTVNFSVDITELRKTEDALRESERNLVAHNHISSCFLRISDDRVYGEALTTVLEVMDSELGVFGYLDENGDLVVPLITMQVWDKCKVTEKSIRYPSEKWGKSSLPRAIREKRVICSNEASTMVPEGHLSISRHISMPIIHNEKVLGLLQVANKKTDYTKEDVKKLATIADYIAPILYTRLELARQRKQAQLMSHDLDGRVRELTCLYGLSQIIAKHGDSIEEIMQNTVLLLPHAYQHPDIACARIIYGDRKHITGNFRETCWSQKADIKVFGEIVGAVEVYYLQEKPEKDKELFLKEEKDLLDAIAERLGRIIERIREQTLVQIREQTSKKSQHKFEGLFRHNPEAAVYLDPSFKIENVNSSFCQLFGYSEEEVKGKNINEVLTPEDMREEAENLDKDAKNGYASHDTLRKRKDGSLVPVSISVAPVTFENNVLGHIGIYMDLSERKRMETALRESEGRLKSIIENSNDLIFMFDSGYRFLFQNKAAADIFRKSPQEMIGKSIFEVFPEQIATQFSENVKKAFDTGNSLLADEKMVVDGREYYNSTSLNPVKDDNGRVIAVAGIVRDITERKKVEKEEEILAGFLNIVNRNTQLEDLIEATVAFLREQSGCEAVGIRLRDGDDFPYYEAKGFPDEFISMERTLCVRNPQNEVLLDDRGNPVLECMCGKVILRRFDPSKDFFTEYGSFWTNSMARLLVTASEADRQTCTRNRCNGEGYESVALIPLKSVSHNIGLIQLNDHRKDMFSSESISLWERISGELSLAVDRALAEELLKQSKAIAQENAKNLKVSNEKLNVVGSLTRHDVRNKLSIVTGSAYLLKRKLAGNPEALEQLADMENAVRDVEGIFEFARNYEKLGVEQLTSVDVGAAFDRAASLFSDLKGVKIVNECGGLTVLADSLLSQLFYNLIDNSLKHGQKTTTIRVHYEKTEEKLKVFYEDDGVGIPIANKSNLFKEGFSTGGSTGYGLFLIKKVVEVYGWIIQEKGDPGKGALFVIAIP